jgi:hypothetical protein
VLAQSAAREDPAAAVVPEIRPRASWRVAEVHALGDFSLRIRFTDGLEGIVKMSELVHSAEAGVFARLADPAIFAPVAEHHGAVTWPGEFDLPPGAMYQAIREHGDQVLRSLPAVATGTITQFLHLPGADNR